LAPAGFVAKFRALRAVFPRSGRWIPSRLCAAAAATRCRVTTVGNDTSRENSRVLAEYLPTLVFLIVAAGIGMSLIVIGNILGPKRPSAEKLSAYECGFNPFEDSRMQFDVRYYLVAILFIVFDLEIAFVYPWALIFRDLGVFGLIEMGIFLSLLVIGFVYVWKRGALEWE
jgi:NADH-quinone oxidoreductase subunit A